MSLSTTGSEGLQTLWVATFNPGKVREFQELLKDLPFKVRSASEVPHLSSPPEDGDTFFDNALIKAKALRSLKNTDWVIADDSGLCVDGLKGLPGVHSARYAGANAGAAENNAKLLKMVSLRCALQREAHFVCHLVAISPAGEVWDAQGQMHGTIAKKSSGSSGFGYDPVFIPKDHQETLGELPYAVKNQISHRAQALGLLKAHLVEAAPPTS